MVVVEVARAISIADDDDSKNAFWRHIIQQVSLPKNRVYKFFIYYQMISHFQIKLNSSTSLNSMKDESLNPPYCKSGINMQQLRGHYSTHIKLCMWIFYVSAYQTDTDRNFVENKYFQQNLETLAIMEIGEMDNSLPSLASSTNWKKSRQRETSFAWSLPKETHGPNRHSRVTPWWQIICTVPTFQSHTYGMSNVSFL